jgi:hypothetical protein
VHAEISTAMAVPVITTVDMRYRRPSVVGWCSAATSLRHPLDALLSRPAVPAQPGATGIPLVVPGAWPIER